MPLIRLGTVKETDGKLHFAHEAHTFALRLKMQVLRGAAPKSGQDTLWRPRRVAAKVSRFAASTEQPVTMRWVAALSNT